MQNWPKPTWTWLELLGLGMIPVGVAFVYVPASIIVAGVMVIIISMAYGGRDDTGRDVSSTDE